LAQVCIYARIPYKFTSGSDPLNPFFTCLICVLQFGHFISPFYIAFTLGTPGKNIPAHRGVFAFDSLFLMWWIQGFVA